MTAADANEAVGLAGHGVLADVVVGLEVLLELALVLDGLLAVDADGRLTGRGLGGRGE